ncbi:peptidyl-prolyl cis-trans isomerase [bacterium]|nr:peptidyl-prolyl cis-trans isomerase [bacterium]
MFRRRTALKSWWTWLLFTGVLTAMSEAQAANPVVVLETSKGPIEIELFADKAPGTVANFLKYVDEGHFNGLIFHRVIDGFMIQGGGFDKDMKEKRPAHPPIKNEAAASGVKNARGTIAMARTNDPNSATCQFFINHKDNDFLNASPGNAGYAAFGQVKSGMEAVDAIAKVATGSRGMHQDVPREAVVIVSAKRKS